MPIGVAAEPDDQEEADALERLRQQDEQAEGAGTGDEPAADTSATPPVVAAEGTDPPKDAAAEGGAAPGADAGPPAAADAPPQGGDVRKALRASRAAERRTANENERLRREVEELRSRTPAAVAPEQLTDDDVDAVTADYPAIEKFARVVKRIAAAAPTPAVADGGGGAGDGNGDEFVPERLHPELQDAVDQVPELLDWQNDPDQTRFELAKAADGLVSKLSEWKGKPLAERMAEVARRVKLDLKEATAAAPAPSAPAKTRVDPQAAIDAAPARTPGGLGEIGGGGGRQPQANDLERFSQMAPEDVEAELMTRG